MSRFNVDLCSIFARFPKDKGQRHKPWVLEWYFAGRIENCAVFATFREAIEQMRSWINMGFNISNGPYRIYKRRPKGYDLGWGPNGVEATPVYDY